MAYGVFGLNKSYVLTRSNVFSTDANHGWFAGGVLPAPITFYSTIDRIDFSNDSSTSAIRGPLSLARQNLAATGNSNYGWFGGGSNPALISTVDRVDFSNDSATASVRGPLSSALVSVRATGNSNYGWFGGGVIVLPATFTSKVDRIDFSNDSTTASVRGPLSSLRGNCAATSDSNYGWFCGGGPAALSIIDRVDFSNDSVTASIRGRLSIARTFLAATGNSNYGWFGAGEDAGAVNFSTVDRVDFSNDSATASVRGPLSLSLAGSSATGNSNYGWFGGGDDTAAGAVSIVSRIDFSNDTSQVPQRGLFSTRFVSKGSTSGQAKSSSIRPINIGNFGWFGAGKDNTSFLSQVDRIDFSNDSVAASSRGPLSAARYELGATGNSNYGWFATGRTTSPITTASSIVDRVDFSNDSATASSRGPLNSVRFYKLAATSNSNYGWFAGGNDPAPGVGTLSTVERIDFSNDLPIASIRGSLSTPAGKAFYDATGNSDYGWFGGAAPGEVLTRVDRIDYANDLSNSLVRGPMSAIRYKSAATGNSNYGWWGGGTSQPPQIPISTVDRIDFSNDSARASVRGPILAATSALSATGNSNYGWWGGGSAPGTISLVNRVDFSNDSVTASPRGSLARVKFSGSATSNTPVG